MNEPKTEERVAGALDRGTGALKAAGVEAPGLEAEFLLTYLLDIKRHELFTHPDTPLTLEQSSLFTAQITRRAEGEPAQYITAVLIPGARITATDLSDEALKVAGENAKSNGVADRIELLSGDLFGALESSADMDMMDMANTEAGFDLILSNPPYIASGELSGLQREVAEYEPMSALDGGTDGLDSIIQIIREAPAHLRPGGRLIMEIGYDQAEAVRTLLKSVDGYSDFSIKKDLNGIERMVIAVGGAEN
jgi:methylase of polypeptide subunit release factors